VEHRQAKLAGQTLGDQRAVASLGIALDAEQCRGRIRRQFLDDRGEVDLAQDFPEEALTVLGRQLRSRALARSEPVVLAVLELSELRRRRELGWWR